MNRRPFLTARWSSLCLFNFAVDRALIAPRLPRGFTPDLWQGQAYVSIVAFQFLDTRVLGVRWPGFVNFPEINLRTYVVAPDGRRGVVFEREYVPSRLVGLIARAAYNEPYSAAAMSMDVHLQSNTITARYTMAKAATTGVIEVSADAAPQSPSPEGSLEHHFKEHQWGFGVTRGGRTLVYEVRHPAWRTHRVTESRCEIDWAALYSPRWACMNGRCADSVVFAEGSRVEVYPGGQYREPSP